MFHRRNRNQPVHRLHAKTIDAAVSSLTDQPPFFVQLCVSGLLGIFCTSLSRKTECKDLDIEKKHAAEQICKRMGGLSSNGTENLHKELAGGLSNKPRFDGKL
jgi:hypothetical protein